MRGRVHQQSSIHEQAVVAVLVLACPVVDVAIRCHHVPLPPSPPPPLQLALRHVASAMAADDATLQGLAQEFRALDPDGSGRIAYDKVVALLNSGRCVGVWVWVRRGRVGACRQYLGDVAGHAGGIGHQLAAYGVWRVWVVRPAGFLRLARAMVLCRPHPTTSMCCLQPVC
jgi:hypothetical protein